MIDLYRVLIISRLILIDRTSILVITLSKFRVLFNQLHDKESFTISYSEFLIDKTMTFSVTKIFNKNAVKK